MATIKLSIGSQEAAPGSVGAIQQALTGQSGYSVESKNALQALNSGDLSSLNLRQVSMTLSGALGSISTEGKLQNENGLAAASLLACMQDNLMAYQTMAFSAESKGLPSGAVYADAFGSSFDSIYSTESFDNQNLTDALALSVGLTYRIARQNDAVEMVYRTLALSPDTGFVDISVPNLYVQNNAKHPDTGAAAAFNLQRVIDSSIDHEILEDRTIKLVPKYSSASAAMFVDTGVIQSWTWTDPQGRRSVPTGALKIGQSINLLGLGSVDQAARAGVADTSEAMDRNVGIEQVFLQVGDDVLAFDIKGLPFSRWIKTAEQSNRGMKLNLPLSTLIIGEGSTNYQGDELTETVFDTIATGKYKVRLAVELSGSADVERGQISVQAGVVTVVSVTNEAGDQISLTNGVGKTIVDGLADGKVVGWFPDAGLTNSNNRHLGLMLNVRAVTERLVTKLRSPFYVPYPLSEDRDQVVLDWLTFAVSSYINNEGITQLIGYHERLQRLTGGLRGELTIGDYELNGLPIEGIGRYLVNGYVQELDIQVNDAQSLDTIDAIENGQEKLLNALRSVAFDILQTTNYENACRYVDGGEITKKFRWAIVTSPTIERFMTVKGDTRSLGAGLDFQLESVPDARLKGALYMTLVREGTDLDILSAGVNLLTPTLVSTIQAQREGGPRKEAIVQPRFQHYNLLPIVVKFNVEGVEELLEETMPFRVNNTVVDSDGAGNGGAGAGAGNGGAGAGGVGGGDAGAGGNP